MLPPVRRGPFFIHDPTAVSCVHSGSAAATTTTQHQPQPATQPRVATPPELTEESRPLASGRLSPVDLDPGTSLHDSGTASPLSVAGSLLHGSNHEDESSSDENPLYSTGIPKEAFDKVVEVLRRQLGFDLPETAQQQASKSKLSLNHPAPPSWASLPVDEECRERFKAAASVKKWTPCQKSQNSFRVDETEWRDLFKHPPVPQSAKDHLQSAGTVDSRGKFKSSSLKSSETALWQIDCASRVGLKYTSVLPLIGGGPDKVLPLCVVTGGLQERHRVSGGLVRPVIKKDL